MNDPKFINSELRVVADEKLQQEVEEELASASEDKDIDELLTSEGSKENCCKDKDCKESPEGKNED